MKTHRYDLTVVFDTPVLGTQPADRELWQTYIASKAAEAVSVAAGFNGDGAPEDEAETLPNLEEKGTTVFHKLDDGTPIYYDYMVKGFLKEVGLAFNGLDGIKMLRSKIDNYVFVRPRQIVLNLPEGGEMKYLERPLRAMTMQGPRTSLARSEMLPEGTWFACQLVVYEPPATGRSERLISEAVLRELLDYGADKGMGQWRNGGMGRFHYELVRVR